MINNILIGYWILTTIYGVYWLVKNPSRFDDKENFTVLDVLANVFPATLCSWIAVPIMLLSLVKFKR
jgi:hypothetical protein